MSFPVKVRPAQKKDRAALALVFQAAFSHKPFEEKWGKAEAQKRIDQILGDKAVSGWVVTVFGQPIGFSFLQVRQGAKELYGELLETAVHPYFQHQGIEKVLLTTIRCSQKARKIKNIFVLAFQGAHARWFKEAGWSRSNRTQVWVSR